MGGRPGMMSGAPGAIAVVIVSLVISHAPEYLFAAVVLMGLIQLGVGFLKLGKFIRLVPHPVVYGFVNGLAIVIFMSQLNERSEEHTSELQSRGQIVCRLLLEKKKIVTFCLLAL